MPHSLPLSGHVFCFFLFFFCFLYRRSSALMCWSSRCSSRFTGRYEETREPNIIETLQNFRCFFKRTSSHDIDIHGSFSSHILGFARESTNLTINLASATFHNHIAAGSNQFVLLSRQSDPFTKCGPCRLFPGDPERPSEKRDKLIPGKLGELLSKLLKEGATSRRGGRREEFKMAAPKVTFITVSHQMNWSALNDNTSCDWLI